MCGASALRGLSGSNTRRHALSVWRKLWKIAIPTVGETPREHLIEPFCLSRKCDPARRNRRVPFRPPAAPASPESLSQSLMYSCRDKVVGILTPPIGALGELDLIRPKRIAVSFRRALSMWGAVADDTPYTNHCRPLFGINERTAL
jgi:hypothetical protein